MGTHPRLHRPTCQTRPSASSPLSAGSSHCSRRLEVCKACPAALLLLPTCEVVCGSADSVGVFSDTLSLSRCRDIKYTRHPRTAEAKLTRWSNDLTILFDGESRLIFSEFSFRLDSPSTEHRKRILTSNAASVRQTRRSDFF